MTELISVIVATYNREDALDTVLRGLSRQTDRHFEVIIADDGSKPPTAELAQRWSLRGSFPLVHVRHEDRGFRLAEIRNRGIAKSAGGICIFLDGDCIPRPSFIAAHRRLSEPGWFVTGNRILISPELTAAILRERLEPELWGASQWIARRMRGEINRLLPLASLRLGLLRRARADAWQNAHGANLAIRRDDLTRVDGFDATFNGWGREDSDIIVRLIRSGTRRKDGRFATGVLHLWHPHFDRSQLSLNERMLEEVIHADRVRAIRGLSTVPS